MELKKCGCCSDTMHPRCIAYNSNTQMCNIRFSMNCDSSPYTKEELSEAIEENDRKYKRQYVIVCNKHNAIFGGALLFWGHRTNDNENRSFGGYTSDFSNCELYTLEEIENKHYHFPIYNDTMDYKEFKSYDDIIIKVDDLKNIKELKTMTVVYRP